MKPRTLLLPGAVTSTTATLLLSALATSSVLPSGDSASAFGVVPGGAFGKSATPICSTERLRREIHDPDRVRVRAGDEQPRSVLRQQHRVRVFADGDVVLELERLGVEGEDLAAAPERDEQVFPSADTTDVYGSELRCAFRSTLRRSRSISDTAVPKTCTAYSRRPSGETETPPTKPESFNVSNVGRRTGLAITRADSGFSVSPFHASSFTRFCAAPEE